LWRLTAKSVSSAGEPADEDFPLLIHDECTFLKNETCDLAFHAKCYDAEIHPRKKGKRSKREKRATARDKCPCSFCFQCHESTINNKPVMHQCRCNSVVHLECISTCEDDLKFHCPICKYVRYSGRKTNKALTLPAPSQITHSSTLHNGFKRRIKRTYQLFICVSPLYGEVLKG
jgi:hypothetical protein